MKYRIFIPLVFLIIGCQISDNSMIVHPTEQNIKVDKDNIIKKGGNLEVNYNIERIANLVFKKEIGTNEEKENEVFGLISDIALDDQNRLYVLDERQQLIRVFNQNGDYQTTLGGRGKGPNEFERAKAFTIYKNKWLMVSNGYRIDVYDIEKEKIKYSKSISLDYLANGLCTIKNQLFVNSAQVLPPNDDDKSPELIVAYNLPSFEKVRSFGLPYLSENAMVVDRLSKGRVSCNEDSEVVMFTFETMPIIYGYEAETGEFLWKSKIAETNLPTIIETNQGGETKITYKAPQNNETDIVRSTITLNENYELFQVDRRLLSEDMFNNEQLVLTYIIDSNTGMGSLAHQELPLFRYISPNKAFSVDKEHTSFSIFEIPAKN